MKTENKAIEPLSDRLPKPLYLVAQHTHGNLETAFAALNDLMTAYPSIRFGIFRNGGKWLVQCGFSSLKAAFWAYAKA